MAYSNGTATSASDLYSKLITFLTTDPDLVSKGQQWEKVWDGTPHGDPDDMVLRGPGLSASDNIYIGMSLYQDASADRFHIKTIGMSGVLASSVSWRDHINMMPHDVITPLDAGIMDYWFVANGRKFTIVVKISTVFESLYAGLILPYSDPVSFPYPLYVAGSAGSWGGNTLKTTTIYNWRSSLQGHTSCVNPRYSNYIGNKDYYNPTGYFLDPVAKWKSVSSIVTTEGTRPPTAGGCDIGPISPKNSDITSLAGTYTLHSRRFYSRLRDGYGGEYPLIPLEIYDRTANQTYGSLDGCYFTQQFTNSAENIITVGSDRHLVVQNVFRVGPMDYWAVKLG